MRSMTGFDKNFRRTNRVFWILFSVVSAMILCSFLAFGFVAFKAVGAANSADWSGGLKPVIEKMWCGKPGCLGAA